MQPTPTAPTPEPEHEAPREHPRRDEAMGGAGSTRPGAELCRALLDRGTLRSDELAKAVRFAGSHEEWKRLLWRLHNEGYLKVRWAGLAEPDPLEVKLTDRGRAWVAAEAPAS
jgi:hypothetical protein